MDNYWQSIEEYGKDPKELDRKAEFTEENHPLAEMFDKSIINAPASRRNFLKMFGFSIATATVVSSCKNSVNKAIPYLIKPEEITPGKATFYASSYMDSSDYCSILVKTREGRPIKIEGNTLSSITKGGTSAKTQASVLSLYDTERLQNPIAKGTEKSWNEIDKDIIKELNKISSDKGNIVLLTSSIYSPSTKKVIEQFRKKHNSLKVVNYDPVSASAIILANKNTFNKALIPSYYFNKAAVIVSFGADFLGTWISPIEFTRQYVQNRKLTNGEKTMSRHIHFETGMSLTGSNADKRIPIKPSDEGIILANLYNELTKITGAESFSTPESPVNIKEIANELLNNKTKSLVVSGSNNLSNQILVNAINNLLGSYGNTIDLNTPFLIKQAIDSDFNSLVQSMNEGSIDALLIYNANPVYNSFISSSFITGLEKVPLKISFASTLDETASLCDYVCPDNHYLESWNDAEPKKGFYSLMQPTIANLFNTRQFQESILTWAGNTTKYHDFIQSVWEAELFPKQEMPLFRNFWNKSLQDGIFEVQPVKASQPEFIDSFTKPAIDKLASNQNEAGFEISFYEKVSIGNGNQANNPWLQEMPDPISKIVWDNYANISPKQAKELNLKNGDVININHTIQLPIFIQPGQAYQTLSVAYGYGRTKTGKVGNKVGENVFPLPTIKEGCIQNTLLNVAVSAIGFNHPLAMTQTHHSMEGRKIVRESTLEKYLEDPKSGNEYHFEIEEESTSLYKNHPTEGHHWGMVVDLNSCIGCGNCVIACQAENNVPVVGKEEAMKNREMQWIRIDRYYNGDPENPETVFQPVMCQHCDNAPCENVCPTAATNHSSEGLNQMIYNRCVGTKYCANNCPYKVRRFNWFDYTNADAIPANTHDVAGMTVDLKRMVLNPDVTVRAKGVMEKCSMCVQRIQEKKLDAKIEGRPLKDLEIQTACMQSCPSNAIIFGDMNDKKSEVSRLMHNERNYHLLEELHVLPSVGYLTKIRNKKA
ncbi:MAG: 4Fe-4S dicluster domain-containing protein [Chlorobi bacterium]|nr:4Fe-4S dicluster domain-containing protein [Chlorobiota bacterium]